MEELSPSEISTVTNWRKSTAIKSFEKTKENSNLLKLQDMLPATLQEMKEDEISNNGLLRFIRATEEQYE